MFSNSELLDATEDELEDLKKQFPNLKVAPCSAHTNDKASFAFAFVLACLVFRC
eukprot:SAG11_NODE_467_length_9212_cov_2.153627_6_plen_54_part_00